MSRSGACLVDELREALAKRAVKNAASTITARRGDAFPAAYQDDFGAARRRRRPGPARPPRRRQRRSPCGCSRHNGELDLKLYGLGAQPSLSDVLPRLAHFGVIVDDEHPYTLMPLGRRRAGSSGSACARPKA